MVVVKIKNTLLHFILQSKRNKGLFPLISKANKSSRQLLLLFASTQPLAEAAEHSWWSNTRNTGSQGVNMQNAQQQELEIFSCALLQVHASTVFKSVRHQQLGISGRHSCSHPGGIMIYCNFEIIKQLFSHFRVQTTTLISLQISY